MDGFMMEEQRLLMGHIHVCSPYTASAYQSFGPWWLPDEYSYITEVPKTSVGTHDKKRLPSMVAEGGLSQVEATIGLAARA